MVDIVGSDIYQNWRAIDNATSPVLNDIDALIDETIENDNVRNQEVTDFCYNVEVDVQNIADLGITNLDKVLVEDDEVDITS